MNEIRKIDGFGLLVKKNLGTLKIFEIKWTWLFINWKDTQAMANL